MKKTSLLILLVSFTFLFCFSQSTIMERKVKISISKGTLGEILDEIALKGDFTFSYGQDIQRNKQITLTHTRQTVQEYLNELFPDNSYCVELGNKLLLMKKPMPPDSYILKGKITDGKTKEAIPGVTIYIPESEPLIGSVSDENGYFQLEVPANQALIKLSCIGYETNSILIKGENQTSIELNPKTLEFSEVKIVYYQARKEENVNEAYSTIDADKIMKSQHSSIEEALQGNAAGVHVVRNSGMPGASIQVKIRGINSLINTDPVYYIDDVYIQQSSLQALSPNDIDYIEIIKDASGTAKYGATGGNGVVLLHSKKGLGNNLQVSFSSSFGYQEVGKTPDLLNSKEFIDYYEKVSPNSEALKEYNIDSLVKADWVDELFHGAGMQEYHVSISGGNDKSRYYFSSGYYSKEAIIADLRMDRYTFKILSEHKLHKRLHVGQNLSFSYLKMKGLNEGSFLNDFNNPVLGAMRTLPVKRKRDTIPIPGYGLGDRFEQIESPIEFANNVRKNYALLGNLNANLTIFRGLSYKTLFGFEVYYQDNIDFSPTVSKNQYAHAESRNYNLLDLSFNWQQQLEYHTQLAGNHFLQGLIAYEFGSINHDWIPQEITYYDSNMTVLGNPEEFWHESLGTEFSYSAWNASLNYNYRNKYFLGFNLRHEKIAYYRDKKLKNHSGLFPSINMAWLFSEEVFFNLEFCSFGKIRYGYGKVGNSPRINYSFYADMIRQLEYIYALSGDVTELKSPGYRRNNEKFYWENIQSHNIGVDLGFFQNKVFLSFDGFYSKLEKGNIYPIDNPKTIITQIWKMGSYGNPTSEVAEMENKGIETELVFRSAQRKFTSDIGLYFTLFRNKVLSIDPKYTHKYKEEDYDIISVNLAGKTANSFYGYKITKLFKQEDCNEFGKVTNQPYHYDDKGNLRYAQHNARAGDYQFEDINKDGKIDKEDKIILGNPLPDFSIGLNSNFQFKGFDLSLFLQGVWGNEIFNVTKFWTYNPYGFNNWTRDVLNSYRKERIRFNGEVLDPGYTDTDLHRIDANDSNGNLRISDFYIEDGSYLRLKDLQLGYSLPIKTIQKAHIQKLRIWLGAQNLLTWTNYSGLDPEVGGWGIDCGIYPQPKTYLIGINLEF